ncbi:hypothetical protein [Microbacterium immunditiarum]|uniref:Uncharacterized protein n=1 Tax=Microbacterium immunditiarum TaxID=337480 RepID=A0A7Y9KN56_9MICO|nr:hypothetical protein [Microbacterium immunditiarum]NYE21489.1 hypothetical protein [Microbacterium immunditiarum]
MKRVARIALLVTQAFVGLTAVAGGVALIVGSLDPALGTVLVPPLDYLDGSPFTSYVVPGIVLIALVAGPQAVAFGLGLARSRWFVMTSAAAAFACVIWIFVQMVFIPFSFLQALYFALGLVEFGLVMVLLGVLDQQSSRAAAA